VNSNQSKIFTMYKLVCIVSHFVLNWLTRTIAEKSSQIAYFRVTKTIFHFNM